MLVSKSICHQGLVRERNEDSLVNNESLGLWVVADGVGGNAHGDIASQLAVQTIERRIRQGQTLSDAIVGGNDAIVSAENGQNELAGMASTVVACRFDGHQFELAWVGDSRAYLLDSTGICQLTSDHNLANVLYQQGSIEEEDLREHVGQHELTQALGLMSLEKIPKSLGELHEGDCLLLCTDGLSGVLTDEVIYQTVVQAGSLEQAGESLLEQVLAQGAPDNVSFSLIQFQTDDRPIKSSDFKRGSQFSGAGFPNTNQLKSKLMATYRQPFDKKAYTKHLKSRPMLLMLIMLSIIFLILFI